MKGHGAAELLTDGMVPSEVHNETLGESEGYRAFYQKVAASFGGSEIWLLLPFLCCSLGVGACYSGESSAAQLDGLRH